MPSDFAIYLTGFAAGLGLILAIGAQNAFVLRQGLRGEHVFAVCLACALSDAILILVGVFSFREIAASAPWLEPAMRYGGAAFLLLYGARSLVSAWGPAKALAPAGEQGQIPSLGPTLAACLALTWLNPHVYLDTVVLLGTISTQYPGRELVFAAGSVSASFGFFFALGYGAALLRPLFARPSSWRVLEVGVAIVMWTIALRLLTGV